MGSNIGGSAGVSLRDTFAAHAMSALIVVSLKGAGREQIAKEAYEWADTMIAARDSARAKPKP